MSILAITLRVSAITMGVLPSRTLTGIMQAKCKKNGLLEIDKLKRKK